MIARIRLLSFVVIVAGVVAVLSPCPLAAQAVIGPDDEIYDNREAYDLVMQARKYDSMYSSGPEVNREKAVEWYEKAIAAQPNAKINAAIANEIAQRYAFNTPVNHELAAVWWRRCVEWSNPTQILWAQANKGLGGFDACRNILSMDPDDLAPPNWKMASTRPDELERTQNSDREAIESLQTSAAEHLMQIAPAIGKDALVDSLQAIVKRRKGTEHADKAAKMLDTIREADSRAASQPASRPQWETDIAEHFDAFISLYWLRHTQGKQDSELALWEAKELKDNPARFARLERAVERYPKTPFADDAALLLARAHFLYKNDSKTAIDALYDVAKKYPDATWFAEDPQAVALAANPTAAIKPVLSDQGVLQSRMRAFLKPASLEYLNYLQEHPNKTADEAKYWIAWIIVKAELADRYGEAEKLLRELSQLYAEENRPEKDAEAAKKLENPLLAKLPRVETNARALLVELKELMGKKPKAE